MNQNQSEHKPKWVVNAYNEIEGLYKYHPMFQPQPWGEKAVGAVYFGGFSALLVLEKYATKAAEDSISLPKQKKRGLFRKKWQCPTCDTLLERQVQKLFDKEATTFLCPKCDYEYVVLVERR